MKTLEKNKPMKIQQRVLEKIPTTRGAATVMSLLSLFSNDESPLTETQIRSALFNQARTGRIRRAHQGHYQRIEKSGSPK